MLNCLSFNYFKRIIVIFSLCTFLMFSYNTQRAEANPLLATAIIAPEVAIGLAALTLTAYGCAYATNPKTRTLLAEQFDSLADDTSNFVQYVATGADGVAQTFVSWSSIGWQKMKTLYDTIQSSSTIAIPVGTDSYDFFVSSTYVNDYSFQYIADYVGPFLSYVTLGSTTKNGPSSYMTLPSSIVAKIGHTISGYNYVNVGTLTADGKTFIQSTGIGGTGAINVSVKVSSGSVCPSKVLKPNALDSVDNYDNVRGIPVSQSISADGTTATYNPSNTTTFPDVLPTSGSVSDVPVGYTIPTTATSQPWIPASDTTGDTTANPDTTGTIDTGTGILSIPILGDILKILQKILDFLLNLVKTLVDTLISALEQLLTKLFVPDKAILTDEFTKVQTDLQDKFPYNMDSLNTLANTSSSEPNFIYSFTVMNVPVTLDLNFIKKVVPYSQMLANGLVAIFLVWYNFRKIIWVIRGTSPITGDGHTGQSSGGSSPVAPPVNPSANSDFRSGDYS